MQGLDEIDYQLIHLLQENARTPIKHLAEAVFMSPPAVAARIARLEKNGVIKGYRPIINLDMFGYNIMAYVNLQLVPGDKARFVQYIGEMRNVLECHNVTGDYSMLIKVAFRNTAELDRFISDLQRFGKTYTQIVFSTAVTPREVRPTP